MLQKYSGIGLLAGIFLWSGCCTKKECIIPVPAISIHFEHFTNQELKEGKIYLLDKQTNQPVDSLFNIGEPYYHLPLLQNGIQLKDYNVAIKTANQVDKIEDISYDIVQEKRSCNKCFLGDGSKTVTNYRNISLRFNGTVINDVSTVTVSK